MDANPVDFHPTELQERFAKIILTSEKVWKYTEIAAEIGIASQTLSDWFNDQRFRIWYENVRARLFLLYKPPIDQALLREAQKGSIKHIELFYGIVGDLVRVEAEKSEEIRKIDSMSTSEQFNKFTQKVSYLVGRMGAPMAPSKDVPPPIDLTPKPDEADDE